ncbi:MAG: hypothetical protein WB441_13220 [Nocardioidaceae bacterium]
MMSPRRDTLVAGASGQPGPVLVGSVTPEARPIGPAGPRRAPRESPGRLRRHSVALALLATLGVHLLFLTRQLGADEGGFAMVARWWGAGGPFLYGPQWVDRPPGLIALFAGAGHLGPYGVRLTTALVAVGMVAALAWAAEAVGGRPAARWTAWTAFAFASSVLLQAQRLNGELAAAAFVAVSMGCLLRALRASGRSTGAVLLGAAAGAAAAAAVLMKQNVVDAFVFAVVLVTVGLATSRNRATYRPQRVMVTVAGFALGVVLPGAATVLWAGRHGGMGHLLYAVVGFRADAAAVLARWSWEAPLHRLGGLATVALLSGLLLLVAHLGLRHRRRLRRLDPLPWALTVTVAVEVIGVLGGGSFWVHYLIVFVPTVALAAGLSVNARAPGAAWTRRLVLLAVATTAVVSPVAAVEAAHASSAAYTTGRWVGDAAAPTDTITVPFTHANVISASGLRPGYPYAWSLPVRTLDPQLSLLTRTLAAPGGPTWVVRWDQPQAWGLDPAARVGAALRTHYRAVGDVCGHTVWLRDGLRRSLDATPGRSACGPGADR